MQRIKRLEAGDSSQARGMDTQAMLPVLAMVAELIAMLGFRWVSVPDLRYSPYAQAGMLWKLEETAKGIAWNYQVPEAMTRAADQAAGYLRIGMAVSVILGLCFILQAFRVKVKAKRLGRLAFLWNTGMTAAVLWWATDTNMALNLLEGRENNFMNLTIYSHVQLTELTGKIQDAQAKLTAANSWNSYWSNTLDSKTNLRTVEEAATTRLGMIKADPSQITYIKLDETSTVDRPASGLQKLAGMLHAGALSLVGSLDP